MKKDKKQKRELKEKRKQAVEQWFEKHRKLVAAFWIMIIVTVLIADILIAVLYPDYFEWYISTVLRR